MTTPEPTKPAPPARPLLDLADVLRLRRFAEAAKDYRQGLAYSFGDSPVDLATWDGYAKAVEDVLRWVAGDAEVTPELELAMGLDQ